MKQPVDQFFKIGCSAFFPKLIALLFESEPRSSGDALKLCILQKPHGNRKTEQDAACFSGDSMCAAEARKE
jgi:hypothetical protein